MGKFNAVEYKNQYNREHYARLGVQVPIEDRPKIDEHWKSKGYKSFNAYVLDLIRKDMNEPTEVKSNIHIDKIKGDTVNIG